VPSYLQYDYDKGLTLKGHGRGPALKGHRQRTATRAFRRGGPAVRLMSFDDQSR